MTTIQNSYTPEYFRVINLVDDAPEQKCSAEGLGRIDRHNTYGSCLAQTSTRLSSKDVGDAGPSRAGSGRSVSFDSLNGLQRKGGQNGRSRSE